MYSCGSRRGLNAFGSGSRRSSIMAELNATRTLRAPGTRTARGVPCAIMQSLVATRGRNGARGSKRIASNTYPASSLSSLSRAACCAPFSASGRRRSCSSRLRHHHGRLRRPADDKAHQRRADLAVIKSGCLLLLHLETPSKYVVHDLSGCTARIHETLNVIAQ